MKNKKNKRKNKLTLLKKISLISVCAISAALIVTASVMLSNHKTEIQARAETEATNRTLESRNFVVNKINDYVEFTQRAGGICEPLIKDTDVISKINGYINASEHTAYSVSTVRFFHEDKVYSREGVELDPSKAEGDLALAYRAQDGKKPAYLGLNVSPMSEYTEAGDIQFYEYYSPIKNNSLFDGLSFYVSTIGFKGYVGEGYRHQDAAISALCTSNGNIVSGDEGTSVASILDEIRNRVGDKTPIDQLQNHFINRTSGIIKTSVNFVDHIISVQMDKDIMKDLAVVEFYQTNMLAKETTNFINSIVAIIVVFVVIMLFALGFFIINHISLERKVKNAENTDIKLGCLNRYGFERECESILRRQGGLYYGVIVIQLRHYKFLHETYGESEVNSLVEYLRYTLQKICKVEEAYGHINEGEFLLMIHTADREALIDRLKIHSFLASQYKGANKFDVSLKYGIYESKPDEKMEVNKMIDYAIEALNAVTKATVENVDMQFNFYNDELRKIRLLNEDMELRQEGALKEGEFQVFYQAKYNLKLHRQDGAEALVRWYDPKTGEYNKPYLFMPLFESNGFIEKLDKYVYTKVCEYISFSIASGKNVFPVSVNVSRITATQPDFIDYYTKIKRKYNIPNGAMTIEFTESFAYENYDILKDIVNRLHKAGFKCSIDDFGCGYSSYRILKELPMDEIKLDKFFIDYSEEPERVNFIFDSVITLAKNLKMKVTQEGVEREEDVELLKQHGCDVIQGYIYSKPISLTDYLHFCEHSKDHNL